MHILVQTNAHIVMKRIQNNLLKYFSILTLDIGSHIPTDEVYGQVKDSDEYVSSLELTRVMKKLGLFIWDRWLGNSSSMNAYLGLTKEMYCISFS